MVTPSSAMSVKSDRPMRPGGCSWRNITSRLGPWSARHWGDAARQGPAHASGELRMATADLFEDRHHPDAGCGLKHRHNLALPHGCERIGAATPTQLVLLRRQPRIGFDPIRGGGGKPRLRGRDGRDVGVTGLHVQPRLAVGDVLARQALILLLMKNQMLRPTAPTARRVRPPGENAPPGMG